MTMFSVNDARSGRLSTSRSAGNIATTQEIFNRVLAKSTRQATREIGLTRPTKHTVLHKELDFRPWKHHYVQELKPKHCESRMEYGDIILALHEDWPELL